MLTTLQITTDMDYIRTIIAFLSIGWYNNMNTCKISGCQFSNRYIRRGYCMSHYKRDIANISKWNRADVTKPRPAIIEGTIAKIPLGASAKKGYAIVDADMAWLAEYKWDLSLMGYAVIADKSRQRLHHFVLPRKTNKEVDHINNDRLDNRKINLRLVSRSQNQMNAQPRSASGYKGVSQFDLKKWRAYIKPSGKQISLGVFLTPEEAAKAYDRAAKKYFGEYAYLNFPRVV